MRYVFFVLLAFAMVACQSGGDATGTGSLDSVNLTTVEDSMSYSVGVELVRNLKEGAEDLNVEALLRGIRDGLDEQDDLLTEEDCRKHFSEYSRIVINRRNEKMRVEGEQQKIDGEAFLAENKSKPGVKTTASGLQYKVIEAGSGPSPTASSTVVTHYKGMLIDGTEFDSSYKRGTPATFPLANVIPGWREGIPMMKKGAKYTFYVPSSLGYGTRGAGAQIPPNSTLIFEVELIDIK